MCPDFAGIDEPWSRMTVERAEAVERVHEAIETLIAKGTTAFTFHMVAHECRDARGFYSPRFSTIERTVRELAERGVLIPLRTGQPGKPNVYGPRATP